MWKQIGVPTEEEKKAAIAKGLGQCSCCKGLKPILKDDCLCFACNTHFRLGREPDKITVLIEEP